MVLHPRRRVPVRGRNRRFSPPLRGFVASSPPGSPCLGLWRSGTWPDSGGIFPRWENGSFFPRSDQGQRDASSRSGNMACLWHGVDFGLLYQSSKEWGNTGDQELSPASVQKGEPVHVAKREPKLLRIGAAAHELGL